MGGGGQVACTGISIAVYGIMGGLNANLTMCLIRGLGEGHCPTFSMLAYGSSLALQQPHLVVAPGKPCEPYMGRRSVSHVPMEATVYHVWREGGDS